MKPFLLRLHRWITLVFSLPLLVLILTGLVLSFEPILQDTASRHLSLPAERVLGLLDQHDPEGKARGIAIRAYENRLVLQGVGVDGSKDIDLAAGTEIPDDGRFSLSNLFGEARGLHEHFIFDLEGVVIASTIAMIVLMVLGVLMGWPRLKHSVSGWHQGMAWFGLPILALSPITGLMIAFGVTFVPPTPQDRAAMPPLREAVTMLGQGRDLGGLIWLRSRGGRLLARVNEGGSFRIYQVAHNGVKATPMNWPRALHEGNFAGTWSGALVVITSLGFAGLMGTGLFIWLRRKLRRRNPARQVT